MATDDKEARVRLERPAPGVLRVMLARPEAANAQDRRMLYELNDAFDVAGQDDDVKVVVLGGDGRHFSAGHDLTEDYAAIDREPVGCWGGFRLPGAEGWMAVEEELFLGLCWRWRNFPKPTIALAQGKTIAGGLMLLWSCDLIIASDDATFSDPVVAFGVNGHEFFVHAWELGARKAKELLFTGGTISAEEARALGMVNRVVARDQLEAEGLDVARRIARMPSIGLKLAKQAVNQSLDAQGQWAAVQSAFSLHQLGHSHAREIHGIAVDPGGAALIRELSAQGR
ncbi:MAG TPA: enoyl-CoA hydratase [Acidimicrobiia bacterium]|jgi:enoyl-CoA hydratase